MSIQAADTQQPTVKQSKAKAPAKAQPTKATAAPSENKASAQPSMGPKVVNSPIDTGTRVIREDQAGKLISAMMSGKSAPAPEQAEEKVLRPTKEVKKQPPGRDNADDQSEDGDIGEDDEAYLEDILSDTQDQDQSDDDQDDDQVDGDEDAEAEGDEEEVLHTVIVDGEELQVTYEELITGYQKNVDYARKSARLAQDRKALQALEEQVKDLPEVRKQYADNAKRFAENAITILKVLPRFLPPMPTEQLLKENPAEYIRIKEIHQEAMQLQQAVKQEFEALGEQNKRQLQEDLKRGVTKLYEMQPELRAPEARAKLREYAIKAGFTDEMIASEPNPVFFQWAYKAMQFDQIMARKAELAKTHSKPKVIKKQVATDNVKNMKQRKRTEVLGNHAKTRSINSAASAITSLLSQK